MTRLDVYWQNNENWYHYEGFTPVINDDAPEEAKESFKRYLEQVKEKKKTGAL